MFTSINRSGWLTSWLTGWQLGWLVGWLVEMVWFGLVWLYNRRWYLHNIRMLFLMMHFWQLCVVMSTLSASISSLSSVIFSVIVCVCLCLWDTDFYQSVVASMMTLYLFVRLWHYVDNDKDRDEDCEGVWEIWLS